jgi:ribosomal protein S18 acetylase RimI-like enzyme
METAQVSRGIMKGNKRLQLFNESTDLIAVRKLIHKTVEINYPGYYDDQIVRFFKDYHSVDRVREQAQKGYSLVYVQNDKIVATGTLVENHISAVYVDPAFQSKGFGKRIMFALLNEAEQRGIFKLVLDATPGSVKFYQRLGFNVIREDVQWIDSVSPLFYYKMERELYGY